MRGIHFSLQWLLGTIAFAAVANVSLFYASPVICWLLNLAIGYFLIVAIIGAIYTCHEVRAFWVGCIVGLTVGWSAYWPLATHSPASATGSLLQECYPKVARRIPTRELQAHKGSAYFEEPPYNLFLMAGQALMGFIVAIVSGILARWFYCRSTWLSQGNEPTPGDQTGTYPPTGPTSS
jgi:hypothetical protein